MRHTCKPGHELPQWLLDLKDNASTTCGEQRDVAAKLDRVAQSLLVVQQHRYAVDLLGTKPDSVQPRSKSPVSSLSNELFQRASA
jgi:hypothetical protein